MKNIYIFINWLSNRNLLKIFIHNWEEYNSEKFTLKRYSRFCSKYPEYWIDDAFTWRSTPQGYKFWERLSINWRKYLLELGKVDSRY